MASFDRKSVTGVYDEILRIKIGDPYDWYKPKIAETVGPYEPELFDTYEELLLIVIQGCYDTLLKASATDLQAIYTRSAKEVPNVYEAWRGFLSDQVAILRKQPFWAASGFGHPDYVCDFEYWARMPSLSLNEAVCFSLGVEPHFLEDFLIDDIDFMRTLGEPLVFAHRRVEQFRRQFIVHGRNPIIKCKDLLAWAVSVELEFHPNALEALKRFHADEPETTSSQKRPDKRELDSVAALFTAMAIERFGYDPTAKRSPTVVEIQNLIASLGIKMSDDTIRHYLRHGASHIDPDWKPHSR